MVNKPAQLLPQMPRQAGDTRQQRGGDGEGDGPLEIGCQCAACRIVPHRSSCAVHNAPAFPNGPCDCGALQRRGVVDLWLVGQTQAFAAIEALFSGPLARGERDR